MKSASGLTRDMSLKNLLLEKKTAILQKWFGLIVESYPRKTAKFLKTKKDRFENPVGHTVYKGMEGILDGLLDELSFEEVSPFLDNIIRIRAVQDFTASAALAFVFELKKVIRQELENEIQETLIAGELLSIESKIDNLALLSFDIYMKCREKVYELKANDARNMTFRLLQRANLICDNQGQKPAQEAENTN